jgi:hypothetical protein
MRANGKTSSISWIADYNLPSLLSHRRIGGVTIGHLIALRFFDWQYVANGRPRLVRVGSIQPAMLSLGGA